MESNDVLSAFARFFTDGLKPSSEKSYKLYRNLAFITFIVIILQSRLEDMYKQHLGISTLDHWLFKVSLSTGFLLLNVLGVLLIVGLVMKRLSKKDRLHIINRKSSIGWWIARLLILFSPSLYLVTQIWI